MIDDVITEMSINKILISILEAVGKISVPALTFLDASNSDKELVITYEEEPPSFIFSLRDKNEE